MTKIQPYSFKALESLKSFLFAAYPNLHVSFQDPNNKNPYLLCGCIEIYHTHMGYEVILFYLGSTRCKLGVMSIEQIATLIYILTCNKEPFLCEA